jgi:acetyltransferase-like isoleucine patch superfamily enzyme/acyl carrier protein
MTLRIRTARWLKPCERVGDSPALDGKPTILAIGIGDIEVGHRFTLSSRPVPSHLVSFGTLRIGDDVSIAHGAAIAATVSVSIGSRTRIGPFFLLMDTDFHGERAKGGARPTTNTAVGVDSGYAPVTIGADVRIGPNVTVLRGTTIGDGATIAPGSVVNGEIPPGAFAQGVPARVLTQVAERGGDIDVAGVVRRVFGLHAAPDLESGPDDIPQWDSLGSLKLLLSLEETLGITLDTDVISSVRSVADLQTAVDQAQRALLEG